jgi:hypothetical protein
MLKMTVTFAAQSMNRTNHELIQRNYLAIYVDRNIESQVKRTIISEENYVN